MHEERWISTLKLVLFILAVIAAALFVTHTDEVGSWLAKSLMGGTQSQIQEILQ